MRRLFFASMFLAAACAPAFGQTNARPAPPQKASSDGVAPKPGLWEVTAVNQTAGSDTKQTIAARLCYGDAADIRRLLPRPREVGMTCELRDVRQLGAQAQWRVACTGKQASLSGAGKLTLMPESFNGSAELMRKTVGGRPVKVEQQVVGQWVGACP